VNGHELCSCLHTKAIPCLIWREEDSIAEQGSWDEGRGGDHGLERGGGEAGTVRETRCTFRISLTGGGDRTMRAIASETKKEDDERVCKRKGEFLKTQKKKDYGRGKKERKCKADRSG